MTNRDKEEINKIIMNMARHLGQEPAAHTIAIKGDKLTRCSPDQWYHVCTACRKIIHQTWDHDEWCELHEPEPLAKWLKSGTKKD